jgi:hypothetical protein
MSPFDIVIATGAASGAAECTACAECTGQSCIGTGSATTKANQGANSAAKTRAERDRRIGKEYVTLA